jgi:cystathionine beta-lyase family protein involved in aluminum resistance
VGENEQQQAVTTTIPHNSRMYSATKNHGNRRESAAAIHNVKKWLITTIHHYNGRDVVVHDNCRGVSSEMRHSR